MLLKVIASLIKQSKQTPEVLDVKRVFVKDLTLLCKDKDCHDNRR